MSEEPIQQMFDDALRQLLARLDSIDGRLEKLEARSYDTKLIWENALKEIVETRAEMREGLRKVERKIDVLNQHILAIRADFREFDERLSKIEPVPSK